MEYRILKENEIKEAIELVARVAKKDIYKDFDQEGINSFNQVNCDTFYRNKQNLTYICLENKKIIGIITLTQGKHLSLLFVDNDYQGNGIGTKLFELIDNLALADLEVNSGIGAKGFYLNLGFKMVGDLTKKNGILNVLILMMR